MEAKSINLSLHFLEQVIVYLREQAQQHRPTNSKNPFIPYRNSTLTNMLRDSLGGNCKSSFLLTISTEKIHFEETVATCRFGQRCGEVKVKISANTEIGLTDQLKDLNSRVKALEKRLVASEEKRRILESQLADERELRRFQTQPRDITPQEKQDCKICVQELLAAAKESLAAAGNTTNNNPANGKDLKEVSEAIIAKSQDLLYTTVENMDKAVLVELSTALGGLVQSMYIEREIVKQEESFKRYLKMREDEEKQELQQAESRQLDILRKGEVDALFNLPHLPQSVVLTITRGAVFIKHSRIGQKSPRFIQISNDLRTLLWRPLVGTSKGKEETVHVPLTSYEGVELKEKENHHGSSHDADEGRLIVLKGKGGNKSMALEYVDQATKQDIALCSREWSEALRYLIYKLSK